MSAMWDTDTQKWWNFHHHVLHLTNVSKVTFLVYSMTSTNFCIKSSIVELISPWNTFSTHQRGTHRVLNELLPMLPIIEAPSDANFMSGVTTTTMTSKWIPFLISWISCYDEVLRIGETSLSYAFNECHQIAWKRQFGFFKMLQNRVRWDAENNIFKLLL